MVDLSEIGGEPKKGDRFPEFQKSAFRGISEASGSSVFDKLTSRMGRRGLSNAERAIAEALGSRIGDYRKATDHMHDVFGQSISSEVAGTIKGLSATSEAEKYVRELEKQIRPLSALPALPDLPPNPIHKTNTHLKNVADTMQELLNVQARQAAKVEALLDVQAKQADMIDALLKAFIASTAAQDRAGKRNLTVAIVSAMLGLAAVIVTLV